ncbi:hypothetical protein GALMADRAFT_208858 [Galerina marginata CBS 339.88]|uniref:Uncharacterized protein n=1 Tax=Galerina marginata (strain CBS 339.88) TaxID=685588 RepID=A0A067T8K6_GALM3|nr:hypothetical protein GALMADRAFT_208858 [Galerina marginata CBS 339.88]
MASRFYPTNNRQPNETYPSGPPPPYAYVPVDPFKPSLAFSLNNILPSRRPGPSSGQTLGTVEGGTLDWTGAPIYSPGNAHPLDQGHPHPPPSRRQDPGRYAPRPTAFRDPQELHDHTDYVPTSYYRPTTGRVDGNYASPALPTRSGQPGMVPPQRRPSEEQATRSSSIIHGVPMSPVPADSNPRPVEQPPAEPPLTRPFDTASYAVPQPTIIQELSQQIPDNASQNTSQELPQPPRTTSSNGPFPRFAFASPPAVIQPPAVIPPPTPSSHQNATTTQHEVLQMLGLSLSHNICAVLALVMIIEWLHKVALPNTQSSEAPLDLLPLILIAVVVAAVVEVEIVEVEIVEVTKHPLRMAPIRLPRHLDLPLPFPP